MLYEFIDANRDDIIGRARERVQRRQWPSVGVGELEHGVPLFLTQLAETLRLEFTDAPFPAGAIGLTATQHGAELLNRGFTVSQVVNDYGDICQVITELATERAAPITIDEFQTLNLCLDLAIAGAVTEFARVTEQKRSAEEVERLGHAAHEMRDTLNTAILGFHMLKRGAVAINGSTGAVLGRSLMTLRELIDRTLSEVRLDAGKQRRERLPVVAFIDEIAATGLLHSEYRLIDFTVQPVEPALAVNADPQLLASAVMNLLHNAFKNTPPGGSVELRAHGVDGRLLIEVADACGGIPESKGDLFQPFGSRRGSDHSGLGLGLSIARKSVRAHGGDISIKNLPGKGCIFTISLPLAVPLEQTALPTP